MGVISRIQETQRIAQGAVFLLGARESNSKISRSSEATLRQSSGPSAKLRIDTTGQLELVLGIQ
jgi:hypothetical protein